MNCPKFGAKPTVPRHPVQRCVWWECDTYQFLDRNQRVVESSLCLRRQLAAVTKDRDELAAAIATPEVYAGVVTRVLEEQLATAIAQRNRAVEACRAIADTTYMMGPAYDKCVAVVAEADTEKNHA